MAQVKNHHSNENHVSANGNSANVLLSQQIQRAQLLNKITTHFDQDFEQQIWHGLHLIREEFNFDNAIVSHIEGDNYIIEYIDSANGNETQGQTIELGTTFCNLVQSSKEVVVINHAGESEYNDHPCYQTTKLESYIGAPLFIDDQFYGTVTFSTQEPYPDAFTEIDIEFIKSLANWISGVLTRKQTAEDLQKTLHEMETLYQYSTVLNESTSLEETFLAAIQPSFKAGATSATILNIAVDDKNQPEFLDLLYTVSKDDIDNETLTPIGTRFAVNDFEISKYWIEKRGPILIGNISEDERLSEAGKAIYKQNGSEATVIYPLISGERWVGVISLNWTYAREFTAVDERQYQSMANQTAAVLSNLLLSGQDQKRAQQLETVAEVSTAVANILDPEEFLQNVVNLTRDQFDLYHAHIYLYDADTETLTLRSGAGEIGRVMVAEGRSIHISQEQSLVARAARIQKGFIINNVKNEPSFLPHPLLPRTASEMAVPIMRQDEMLGVLDVQSQRTNNFTQDDLLILTSFGAQIATALKNAQAFEQVVQAEQTAQVSQARTEAILKSVSLPLVITRIYDGLAMYANEPMAETLRMDLKDIVGQRSPDFYYDANDRAGFLKMIQEQGYVQNHEIRLKRIDGEPFWALVSSRPLIYDGDNAIITTVTDITDRKEAQERTETILKSVNLPLAITRISDGYGLYANEPFAETFKISTEEFIGKRSPNFYVNPEDRAGLLAGVEKEGYIRNYEALLKRYTDEPFWAILSSRAIIYGGHESIMTTILDITERKEATEVLRQQEEDLEALLESSPEAIGVVNTRTGLFESPNKQAEILYGLSREELVKVGPAEMSPEFQPDGRPSVEKAMEKIGEAIQGGTPVFEWMHINSSGDEIPCEIRLVSLGGERSHLIRFSVTNISERKALQEELQLLKQAVDASTQPITIADARQEDMPLVYINPAFVEVTGYSIEETIGQNCRFLQNEDIDQEGLDVLREAIKSGEACDVEIRNYKKDGTLFWNRLNLSPVKNAIGEVTHYIGSQRDVTRQKEDEQRLAKQAVDLATVAEVSTAVSTIQNTNEMLQTVVDLTKERFNLYHAHIFTLDEASNALILRAGAGEIGREMVAEGRQIPLAAEGSLVATVGRNKAGLIRNYEGEMEGYAPHPALIDTRTELAVPLVVGGELLGVLDVRSEELNAFTETDVQIQTTLASQVAIALQNARSFEQMKSAEQELRTSSEFLDAVLNAIPNPIFVKDQEHRWLMLNGAMTEWMGQSAEHFIGKSDYDFFPKEEADVFWQKDRLVFDSKEAMVNEELLTDATGFQRSVITTKVSHILNTEQQILIGSILDVTNLKEIESELRANQAQLQAILDNLPVGVFVADAKTGVPQLANNAALELLGRGLDPSGADEYTEVYQTYRPDQNELLPAEELPLVKTMTTGEINYGQVDIVRTNDRITVDVTAVPIFDEDKNITSAIALFQDITERRQSEAQLRLQNNALEAAANGIAITDRHGKLVSVNSAFTSLTGYDQEEVIGQSTSILKSGKQDNDFYADLWKTVLKGNVWHGELVNRRKDGSLYTEEMTITPVRSADEEITHFIAIKQDVTERKLAEAQLIEAQERSQTILESITVPLLISRVSDGVILYANEQLADLIVINLEDLIDQPTPNFYFNAEDRQKVIGLIRENGAVRNYELHLRRNNGEDFWGLLSARLFSYQGEMAILTSLIDITDRKEAQESITKQAAELKTVADISTTVSTTLDTDILLQDVVDLTKANFGLYHAHIYLVDNERKNLVLTAGAGEIGQQMVQEKRSIPLDREQSLVAQAAQKQVGVIVNDTQNDPNFLSHPLLPNTKAEMAIPMIVGNDLLGVLDVQADRVGHFNDQDINIQTTLASQIAIALQNARQYEQTQMALAETASQAESLEQLTALSLALTDVETEHEAFQTVAVYASHIVHSQRTSIAILNKDETHLELFSVDGTQGSIPTGMVLPVGGTAIGQVSQSGQILTITDTANSEFMDAKKLSQTGILSAIVAPLMVNNEIVGTMNFGLTTVTTENLRREQLIQQITSLFGQSLANSRLLSQIQQQATQLRTVAEVGTSISTIQNPQEMLQVMVDLTKESFGLYHSHVFLLNDTKDTLILTAGAGEVGREMVLAGRQIPLAAEQSLVATVARTRQGIIRNYAEEMEGFMPHPLLIDTRAELAVPIIVADEVLGVLDVRSENLNAFDDTDVQIQSTLASQAAVALQNARQFEATEKARRELTVLTQRLTHEGWDEFMSSKPTGSLRYGYNLQNIQTINEDQYTEADSPNILVAPLEIQGAKLGQVNLHMRDQADDETFEMVQAIVGNLSAHIENLRLTEQTYTALAETEAQAERLANLNEISAILGQSANLQELYNSTATQIMEMFDADRVSITMLDASATKLGVVVAVGDTNELQEGATIDLNGSIMAQAINLKDFVENSTEDFQTIIHIPVLEGNEAIGTINLAKYHKEVINDSDRNLLRQVANMLSINMTNQKLFAAAQNRAERERRVRAITDRIRRGGDRDAILNIAREEIAQLLGAQKSTVHLGTQQQLMSKLRPENEQDKK